MRQPVNTDTEKLIRDFSFPESIPDNRIEVKRGDSKNIDFQFGRAFGISTALAEPTGIKFGAKIPGDNDGPYVVSNYDENEEDFVFIKSGAGADLIYRVSPSWFTKKLNNLLGNDPEGFEETVTIRCVGDSASSLNGKYFTLQDRSGSVGVWFDVAGGTAAPAGAAACARQIEITTVTANMAAGDVAAQLAAALNSDVEFSATALGSLVTVEDAVIGPRAVPAAATSGFVVARWIAGSLPNTLANVSYIDLDGELERSENGAVSSTLNFGVRVYNDINKGNEGVPKNANPAYPSPANLLRRVSVPANSTVAGVQGNFATNANYLFVYTGDGTTHAWLRLAGATEF